MRTRSAGISACYGTSASSRSWSSNRAIVCGYPYKFYRLTEQARELFDRNDLVPADAWQRQYARVEKTGEIAELEAIPRPE